jgi:uncharacterized protein (TIGR02001 family)
MKVTKLALAAVFAATSLPAALVHAQEAKSDWSITGNAGLYTDYRFRGISQTDKKPAFQGGFDIAHSSGFYLGNWNSNIDSEFFGGANLEIDVYGGYKTAVGDVGLDFGGLYYYYPNSDRSAEKIKNFELYVGGAYGPVSAKLYYPISDFFSAEDNFGGGNAAGSYYLDLSGAYDLGGGFGLSAHVGYQKLKGAAKLTEEDGTVNSSYVDWKLAVSYTFSSGFVATLAYIDTNRDYLGVGGTEISDSTAVLSLSKSF